MSPASRFKRILAYIIDSILISIPVTAIITTFIVFCTITDNRELVNLLILKFNSIFIFLVASLYFAFFESSKYQASLGKKFLNLYVCDSDNRKLSFMRALSRCFLLMLVGILPMCFFQLTSDTAIEYISRIQSYNWLIRGGFLLCIGCLIPVFFTKDRKTIYDMLSASRVYSRKPPKNENA